MARLMSLIAALPKEGREAFTALVVDELMSVLRSTLVVRVRHFCNAAVRRGVTEKHFGPVVWEALLVLYLLSQASRRNHGRASRGRCSSSDLRVRAPTTA